jgi:NAD(P)-dependent dehydrogenase (short-subunit alcohol dehydrogenase family)
MDFKGQVAMITGGARGIGRSIAGHLAQNGANLAIADVSEKRQERPQSNWPPRV